jgi:hypothetical protein
MSRTPPHSSSDQLDRLPTSEGAPKDFPKLGGGGYFAIDSPADDQHNPQLVCTWDGTGGTHRVVVAPGCLYGWGDAPPPDCDWLPREWPADHFPLGSDPRQRRAWLNYVEFLFRTDLEHACGSEGIDHRRYGWRAGLRAARRLARHSDPSTPLPVLPLPTDRAVGLGEFLLLKDAILAPDRRPKKPTGRPPDTDPKEDQRLAEAWASGKYTRLADLAREFGMKKADVVKALDRHRKRCRSAG